MCQPVVRCVAFGHHVRHPGVVREDSQEDSLSQSPTWICSRCHTRFDEPMDRCPNDGRRLVVDLSNHTLADRYILKSLIGVGGMNSSVWQAWQKSTERTVAIKVLPPADAAAAGRFSRGARIASNISHPHATIVHDYGQTPDGKLYLVMEMLVGRSLHRLLKQSGNLPVPRAVHITEQVLKALEAAHKQRVVHRDLKPGNLFLVERNEDEDYVKVLDFGIAKYIAENPEDGTEEPAPNAVGDEVTQERQVCGTPHYMAPEQVALGKVDARTDLYALGVVLYRMLTGRLPFEGKSHHDLFRQHLTEAPPRFADVRGDLALPETLESLVRKALEKDPDARFQSAREMRAALRVVRRNLGVFSTDEPESSSSWGTSGVMTQTPWQAATVDVVPPARRRRGLWLALSAAGLLLLGGLVWWQWSQREAGPMVAGPTAPATIRLDDPALRATPEPEGLLGAGQGIGAPAQRPAPPVKPDPEAALITVTLQSDPQGAAVVHEGETLGQTPIKIKLPEGDQVVRLMLPGHMTERLALTLIPGQAQQIHRRLLKPIATEQDEAATAKLAPEPSRPTAARRPDRGRRRGGGERRRGSDDRRGEGSKSAPEKITAEKAAAEKAAAEKAAVKRTDPESGPGLAAPAQGAARQASRAPSTAVNLQLLDEDDGRTFQLQPNGKAPAPGAQRIQLLDVGEPPAAPSRGGDPGKVNIQLINE